MNIKQQAIKEGITKFTQKRVNYNYDQEKDLVAEIITDTVKIVESDENDMVQKIKEALEWVLPMAQAYAHQNAHGRNREIVAHAKKQLQALTPTKTDKQTEV